ncbi:MAG TPA: hypothetical protein VN903_08485 [Polyangia bacterium]|jgi:hypothetical protein|nr:hypothetical protein [Polyangia bacterium]
MLFVACAMALAPVGARAAGSANAPAKTKTTAKKAGGKKKPAAEKSTTTTPAKPLTRTLRPSALTVNVGHEINEDAHVTPFPSFAGHAKKALAQNRRDQLIDAEQAARADKQSDRWWTVLFHLRELDSRNDAEACFWRVVAYYRLGELAKARGLRGVCEPPQSVQTVLDNEDALSTTLQPVAALPEMMAAGEKPPAPVINPEPYSGPAYTTMMAQASAK